jgi:hypothetical protein
MAEKKCENIDCINLVEGKTLNGSIRRFCSKKCSNLTNSRKSRERFKETCRQKYGGCGNASESIKKKVEDTNLKRYGYKSYLSADEKKIKTKDTNLEKYGVEHHLKAESCKLKQKDTNLEKYGVENVSQLQSVKDKKISTTIKNYGVEHHFRNEDILENRRKTCLERYGYEFIVNRCRIKEYVMPSGKSVKIMGYEYKALDELLKIYREDEIILGKNIPRISYTGLDGKMHKYYPDIYIPKENLIIEVKSELTFRYNQPTNLLKEQATKDAGYNYRFMIY